MPPTRVPRSNLAVSIAGDIGYTKPRHCLTLCDRFVHDFACPALWGEWSFSELEQNVNLLRTTATATYAPREHREHPARSASTSGPDTTEDEIKLDFGLLHGAIIRSCGTKKYRGLQDSTTEEADAAVILMSMSGDAGPPYKPTLTDILYHEFSYRNELVPGASNEEIQRDINVFYEAVADQESADWLHRNGVAAAKGRGSAIREWGVEEIQQDIDAIHEAIADQERAYWLHRNDVAAAEGCRGGMRPWGI